jgi:choline kinase
MKVVIIAAGMGSRLWDRTNQRPKTLLPFAGGTILSTIVGSFRSVGLSDFVIVVGFNAPEIAAYVRDQESFGVTVELVENPEWERANGVSVLVAATATGGAPFMLSMSDHVVSPGAIELIARERSEKNLLLVDRNIDRIFDIDDATKVRREGRAIVEIGKSLASYDALDCGVFRLNDRFLAAMRRQAAVGREGISDGVTELIRAGDMDAVVMNDEHEWHDLDTPEAYEHGLARASVWAPTPP